MRITPHNKKISAPFYEEHHQNDAEFFSLSIFLLRAGTLGRLNLCIITKYRSIRQAMTEVITNTQIAPKGIENNMGTNDNTIIIS